jgi:hypothetical protein
MAGDMVQWRVVGPHAVPSMHCPLPTVCVLHVYRILLHTLRDSVHRDSIKPVCTLLGLLMIRKYPPIQYSPFYSEHIL